MGGRGSIRRRQALGSLMMLVGVLMVFLCLPMQFFLIVLGAALTAAGLVLLC